VRTFYFILYPFLSLKDLCIFCLSMTGHTVEGRWYFISEWIELNLILIPSSPASSNFKKNPFASSLKYISPHAAIRRSLQQDGGLGRAQDFECWYSNLVKGVKNFFWQLKLRVEGREAGHELGPIVGLLAHFCEMSCMVAWVTIFFHLVDYTWCI
jgi:hypothetical protein